MRGGRGGRLARLPGEGRAAPAARVHALATEDALALADADIARYARQLTLPGHGPEAQERLRAARVHVVGAGEVAGPALLYLAAAGVGTLLVDDALDVAPEDAAAWIYPADQVGQPRALAAMAALREVNGGVRARPYATGADPTAALVCATASGVAREAAERARVAGLPHVVATAERDGGSVVAVPPGAPCYACAARYGSGGGGASPGASAAVGALAALELLLLLTGAVTGPGGRRVDLARGELQLRVPARVPGCPCGVGRAGAAPDAV